MTLAVVKDLRVARAPATAEDLEALETDVLAGFVPHEAAVGDTIRIADAARLFRSVAGHPFRRRAPRLSGLLGHPTRVHARQPL